MSASIFPIALGIGAVALATRDPEPAGPPRREDGVVGPGITPPPPMNARQRAKSRMQSVEYGQTIANPSAMAVRTEIHTSVPREIMDRAEKRMKEEFNKLNDTAKREVCMAMKAEFPGDENIQQLDCSAPAWETLVQASIAVGFAAAGTAICGPACGAIGAALGGVVGVAVTDWGAEAWEDLSDDAQGIWDESGEWVDGVWEDAKEEVGGFVDKLNPLNWF